MNWRTDVKKWFHSLTIWWSGALAVAGVFLAFAEMQFKLIEPYLGKWGPATLFAIGLVNVWLRLRTASAIAGTKAAGKASP